MDRKELLLVWPVIKDTWVTILLTNGTILEEEFLDKWDKEGEYYFIVCLSGKSILIDKIKRIKVSIK